MVYLTNKHAIYASKDKLVLFQVAIDYSSNIPTILRAHHNSDVANACKFMSAVVRKYKHATTQHSKHAILGDIERLTQQRLTRQGEKRESETLRSQPMPAAGPPNELHSGSQHTSKLSKAITSYTNKETKKRPGDSLQTNNSRG